MKTWENFKKERICGLDTKRVIARDATHLHSEMVRILDCGHRDEDEVAIRGGRQTRTLRTCP